jgi:hypothetical protein
VKRSYTDARRSRASPDAVLVALQSGEARRSPQFSREGALSVRKIERTPETALRNGGVGLILQQQEFAFDP